MTREDRSGAGFVCPCHRDAATLECHTPVAASAERRQTRRTRDAAAWGLPSLVLALVPKCPMCVAAYLAIGGGLSVPFTTAAYLRTALVWLCWSVLLLLTARLVMRRMRGTHSRAEAR